MDIFLIFTLCGGLAFFLYGMQVMSGGLEKVAGGRLEQMLRKMTSSPFKSLILGAGITIAVQSSSALTVMLVGLVNSGIMTLKQTIGVIMGSNVGTTLTAWILSLSGIESSNFFLRLLKPESFSPVIALVGILCMMVGKTSKAKSIGSIFVGFAVLMYGMIMMTQAMSPLADMPEFSAILMKFSNPLLGVIAGAVFTGIIQSSAASVGILQALSLTGSLSFGTAIPIIMGQNIGTCVTALLSSVGVNTAAKRVSVIHISFNVIGTAVFLTLFYIGNLIFPFKFLEDKITPFGIALAHSVFNIGTTLILLPFAAKLENLANMIIKDADTEKKEKTSFLDERLLRTPSFAVSECSHRVLEMSDMAEEIFDRSIEILSDYKESKAEEIFLLEKKLDKYEDKLGTYLVKISGRELSDDDGNEVSKLLHTIGDFERIGDHALGIMFVAKKLNETRSSFSPAATNEINTVISAVKEVLELTTEAFHTGDIAEASKVEPLEQVIDDLISEIKNRHVERLREGICTIELGILLSDLLTNFARISDHCSNIAACIIQIKQSSMNRHKYLNKVKNSSQPEYVSEYEFYSNKYLLDKGGKECRKVLS